MKTNVSTEPKVRFTPSEYLELERKAETKSDKNATTSAVPSTTKT